MPRLLKWVSRPAVLIAVSVALVGTAALIVFQSEPSQGKPQPATVRAGEQEIAFLYPATSTTAWERFVTSVDQARGQLQAAHPEIEVVRTANSEDTRAQTVPAVALRWPGAPGRLVFRWYKLTSDWTTEAWVDALLARNPPPLAIIGGSNTWWARELALQLNRAGAALPEGKRPLLLLTTATADRVRPAGASEEDDEVDSRLPADGDRHRGEKLTSLYPGHTFRFSFTNRQMATAVTRFIWGRPGLRPDGDPAYVMQWTDDPYSRDLSDGYQEVLGRRAVEDVAFYVGYLSGGIGLRLNPASLAGWDLFGLSEGGGVTLRIASSAGSFWAPNIYEADAAQILVREMQRTPEGPADSGWLTSSLPPHRPLLVVTGQAAPGRRFLREVARLGPITARRFVVALGDTVSFNTIYRDRCVTWPILDLPFSTVFFCHRNPIDAEAGFHAPDNGGQPDGDPHQPVSITGTEDLLLFSDLIQSVALAFARDGSACRDGGQLAQGLRQIRFADNRPTLQPRGVPLFKQDGHRQGSTGETVVYLKPKFQGDRVLLEAVIEVWCRAFRNGHGNHWAAYGKPLTVSYTEDKLHGDRSHGSN